MGKNKKWKLSNFFILSFPWFYFLPLHSIWKITKSLEKNQYITLVVLLTLIQNPTK